MIRPKTLRSLLPLLLLAGAQIPCAAASLGVYEGNGCSAAKKLGQFDAWFGGKPDFILDFFAKDSWSAMLSDASWTIGCWQKAGATPAVFSVPMLPKGAYTLADGAAGKFDGTFQSIAALMVSHGYANATVRLGWEFNGGWFTWSAKADPVSWVAYWRRIVSVMRSVPGSKLKFDWCPNLGQGQLKPNLVYPGDDVVDFIGEDVYNESWASAQVTPEQRWNTLLIQSYGLQWQVDFARTHNKPLSFPEWGTGTRPDGHGGGDDPYFIKQMAAWIATNNVAYDSYWDYPAPDYNGTLSDGHQPLAGAAFQNAFGKRPRPPTDVSTGN